MYRDTVLVSSCCSNKLLQIYQSKQHKFMILQFHRSQIQHRCHQAKIKGTTFLIGGSGKKNLFIAIFSFTRHLHSLACYPFKKDSDSGLSPSLIHLSVHNQKRIFAFKTHVIIFVLSRFSHVRLCVTLWTTARQAPLEWVAISCSRVSSLPGSNRHLLCLPALGGGFFTTDAAWEA